MKKKIKAGIQSVRNHGRLIFVGLMFVLLSGALIWKEVQERKRVGLPGIQSGPWGDMLVWDIKIQQPEEYLGFFKLSSEGPFWNFGQASEKTVEHALSSSGCSAALVRQLLDSRVAPGNDDFVIRPPEKLLLSLDKKTRANLYLKLANNPKNFYQANPILVPGGNFTQLLHGQIQNPERIQGMYQRLCYDRNGYTYFSDPEVILRALDQDPKEREAFLKFLTTIRAVMASILVKPDTEIDLPVMYWGLATPGLRIKDLYPLFEAQKSLPGGGAVPMANLLPEKARNQLYKTPLASASQESLPDCHFAALSFFTSNPDPRFADTNFVAQYLANNYYEIGKPSLTGDLVLLVNSRNVLVHTGVHLAGDVVYSKNGANLGQPWVLMREKDMVGLFSALEPVNIRYMRWNRL
jgi:hypothetical protein